MTATLRWLLPILMLAKLVVASNPTVITGLRGCRQINNTALDGCSTDGGESFLIYGTNMVSSQTLPMVSLTSMSESTQYFCSRTNNQSTSPIQCTIPTGIKAGEWRSVRVLNGQDGEWSNALSPGVFLAPPAPVITSLQGCNNQVNSTALDQCSTAGSFYLYGENLQSSVAPTVQLTSGFTLYTIACAFVDFSQSKVQCITPNQPLMEGLWWAVSIRTGGQLSEPVYPGLYIAPDVPGAPCPNIESIGNSCDPSGCVSGFSLTIFGSQLIDNSTRTIVSLAPDFFNSPSYPLINCPLQYASSSLVFCTLPMVPLEWLGQNLQVMVTNAFGSGIITGPLMYSAPISSSSTGSPYVPPYVPPTPSSSGSSVGWSTGFVSWIVLISVVVFIACCLAAISRRTARRRAVLAAYNPLPHVAQPARHQPQNSEHYVPLRSEYVQQAPVQNHAQHTAQAHQPAASAQPTVIPAQGAYPAVHGHQYVPPQPLSAIRYQPAAYPQYYQAGPYQPSAPSAYPPVYYQY